MQRCDLSGDPEADGCGCSDDARSWCDPTLVRDGDWCVPEMPLCSFGEPGEACVYDGEPLPEGTRVGLHLCVHGEWLIVADCGAYSDRSACVDTPGCGYCTRAAGPTECVEGSLHGPFGEIEPCDEWVPAMVECPLS